MPTLTASPAMQAHLAKIAPLLARPAPAPLLARPAPAPILTDPAQAARRARFERQSALLSQLREIAPALFATDPPPPLMCGIHKVLVERLALTVSMQRDLRHILKLHVHRRDYQEALAAPGAMRVDLAGHPVAPVTIEHRAQALEWLES